MSVPENLYAETKMYYFLYLFTFLMIVMGNFLSSVYFGIGNMTKIFIIKMINPVITLISAYVMIALFGMKIAGVALVTAPASIAISFLVLIFIFRENKGLNYKLNFEFIAKNVKKLAVNGFIYALRTVIIAGGYLCVSIVINRTMSENFIAAFAVELPLTNILLAIAPSFALFCIKNKSMGKTENLKKGLKQGIILLCSIAAIISVIYLFFGNIYYDAIGIKGELRECALYYWRCRSIGIIPLAILCSIRYYMENTGYITLAFFAGVVEGIYTIVCAFVLIPLGGKFFAASYTSMSFLASALYCVVAYLIKFKNNHNCQ